MVFNIENHTAENNETDENFNDSSNKSKTKKKSEKIETCYTCGKKFDMNKEDGSRYRYEKFPLCAYCAEFYGFYFEDPGQKRKE